jgi:NAD(P)-dependent dehydrogenase (short-subunit alcohol dehydrogenase family)
MSEQDSQRDSARARAPIAAHARGEAPGRDRLAGRRILIIGAGQQDHGLEDPPVGNGRAMSILFAREGASLAIADIDEHNLLPTAELARAEGADVHVHLADAADEDAVAQLFAEAHAQLGGLDGVVLNVGVGAGLMLSGTSAADWDRVMAVNARSQFLGVKHALKWMADGGAVVMIGSVAAREVLPIPAYGASKAALESLCRQAATEGAPMVRCNLLEPGLIDTSLGRLASQLTPRREQVRIPARRHGTAWEVAHAALFLISEEASYVTGHCLIVDGGLTVAPRA